MIKELRRLLVKGVSILLAFCYLFSPLHNQIGELLHSFSHGLESPEYILSHSSPGHSHDLHYHEEHTDKVSNSDHDHLLVAFVKNFLEASTTTDPFKDQQSLVKINLDKHYFSGGAVQPPTLKDSKPEGIYYVPQKPSKGYPLGLYSPPIAA